MKHIRLILSEIEDIWKVFKIDVEKSGLKSGLISACEMPHGFISSTRAFTFGYDKNERGDWVLTNPHK